MDAVTSFFAKYHAVPVAADRRGVERIAYEAATDAALCGHADGNCRGWDEADLPAHVRLDVQNQLLAIRDECWKRMQRFGVDYTVDAEPEAMAPLRRAWYAACVRVGFGPSN
jgi:hypothetical protein